MVARKVCSPETALSMRRGKLALEAAPDTGKEPALQWLTWAGGRGVFLGAGAGQAAASSSCWRKLLLCGVTGTHPASLT